MDLLEDYSAGTLSKSEYPFVREPDNMENNDKPIPIKSARTSRSTTSVVGETSDVLSRKVESSLHLGKRRLVVFIIGGATRAELRVVHRLTSDLGREVVLGSTHMLTAENYVDDLMSMSEMEDVGL